MGVVDEIASNCEVCLIGFYFVWADVTDKVSIYWHICPRDGRFGYEPDGAGA